MVLTGGRVHAQSSHEGVNCTIAHTTVICACRPPYAVLLLLVHTQGLRDPGEGAVNSGPDV